MSLVHLKDDTFESEVLNYNGVVLVDFWAAWCPPCKMIGPIVEELAKEYEGKAKITKLEVDENPETPSKYNITGIPTLIIFKNGEKKDSIVGAVSKTKLIEALESALA